jgi:chorismate synthase
MTGNIFGTIFKIVSFGESHGRCVGVVIDGCPAGLKIKRADIQKELDKRRPGKGNYSTTRKETDQVEILSGVFNNFTTGAPICLLVWNRDVDSSQYEKLKDVPRPGHADYTARTKYGGYNDYRGGGRFSGRITISLVLAGAIAKKILNKHLNIEILSYTKSIGTISSEFIPEDLRNIKRDEATGCIDTKIIDAIKTQVEEIRKLGDSLGGIIETIVKNIPVGLGEPFFDTMEGDISKIMFSIPAIKAIEFGSGFEGSKLRGSENNDPYGIQNNTIITKTNNSGGILGGITDGMPIDFRVAIKPTPSISKTQKSVDLSKSKEVNLKIEGRHDTLIVPRAIPVIENTIAIVLLDHLLRANKIPKVLR